MGALRVYFERPDLRHESCNGNCEAGRAGKSRSAEETRAGMPLPRHSIFPVGRIEATKPRRMELNEEAWPRSWTLRQHCKD